MPDENPSAGTVVPAAPAIAPPTVPAAAPAAPVVAPVPPAVQAADPPGIDPQWLTTRLERAKSTGKADLLKELGAADPAAAKAAIEAARVAAESTKTAEQRALEAANKLSAAEQARSRSEALIKEQASRMMMVLSPEQQKAITDFAGEDPAEQLRTIQHFVPLWARPAEPVAATPAQPAAAAAAPASQGATNTSPPPLAPPAVTPGSPPDHKAVYSSLSKTNPFAAAAYGLQHFGAVHNQKP